MIVKIIKVDNPDVWYRNHIGYICDVTKLNDTDYIVSGNDFSLIAISDCEILIDENTRWILL